MNKNHTSMLFLLPLRPLEDVEARFMTVGLQPCHEDCEWRLNIITEFLVAISRMLRPVLVEAVLQGRVSGEQSLPRARARCLNRADERRCAAIWTSRGWWTVILGMLCMLSGLQTKLQARGEQASHVSPSIRSGYLIYTYVHTHTHHPLTPQPSHLEYRPSPYLGVRKQPLNQLHHLLGLKLQT